jgi:hypothetical protein
MSEIFPDFTRASQKNKNRRRARTDSKTDVAASIRAPAARRAGPLPFRDRLCIRDSDRYVVAREQRAAPPSAAPTLGRDAQCWNQSLV